VECEPRPAAYAVIRNDAGAVAAVRVPAGYWLPGGGGHPGETPEETVEREVREELGGTVRILGRIGEALEYFDVPSEGKSYAMRAVFFRVEWTARTDTPAEYPVTWLEVGGTGRWFHHASHDWAVRQG
jgi:8-oxo-dGTP pyrophosphatase MutT (NUDIX family)